MCQAQVLLDDTMAGGQARGLHLPFALSGTIRFCLNQQEFLHLALDLHLQYKQRSTTNSTKHQLAALGSWLGLLAENLVSLRAT